MTSANSVASVLTLVHPTRQRLYILEETQASRLQTKLLDLKPSRDDIESVSVRPATDTETRRFHGWRADSNQATWLKSLEEQMHVRIVPTTPLDELQPQETALMMAVYSLSSDDLRQSISTAGAPKPGVHRHKSVVS